MAEQLNEQEVAEILLLLARAPAALPKTPPADILADVPKHGKNVDKPRDRSLLLSSIGAITAIMGAGFVYIQKLFEDAGYDLNILLTRPTWGEYLIHLSPEEKQLWCTNTAYYIDAMRNNQQLEVVEVGGKKKIRPLRESSAVQVLTPTSSMTLNGDEIIQKNGDNIMVYTRGHEEIVLPEDPIELSAFCMAHFFHKENVQTLINWGENFKLISEKDLLQLLGEKDNNNGWKQTVVHSILKNAFNVYKDTAAFDKYINENMGLAIESISNNVDELKNKIEYFKDNYPNYKEKYLLKIATEHPELWLAGNKVINYPIQSSLVVLFLTFYMRKEIKSIVNTGVRFFKWLTGKNPDIEENALVVRGGEKRVPTIIVINNSLSEKHIDELSKLFDKDSIDSFLKYINTHLSIKKRKTIKKRIKNALSKLLKKDPTSVAEIYGGKLTKKRKHIKRKTQKR